MWGHEGRRAKRDKKEGKEGESSGIGRGREGRELRREFELPMAVVCLITLLWRAATTHNIPGGQSSKHGFEVYGLHVFFTLGRDIPAFFYHCEVFLLSPS